MPAVGCGHGCRRGPGLHTGGDRCAAVGCDCLLCVWGGAGLVTVCQTFVLFGQGTPPHSSSSRFTMAREYMQAAKGHGTNLGRRGRGSESASCAAHASCSWRAMLAVSRAASIAESPRRYMRHRSSRAILARSMPCQANNACASSHHCSNGIIAMLPKTESVWRKANTDDALVVGRLSPAASVWRTPPRRPRADDIGVRIGRAPGR